jgi:transposase InsO family protein
MVVGWAMDTHRDGALVENARPLALLRRHLEPGLPHHSDRTGQYTCHDYQQRLSSYGIGVSMSRKGDGDDNALMESC